MSSFWINMIVIGHVLVALAIIGLVLLQHGKGADMGSGFGGGASSSLFGATGSANFLSRATAALATLYVVIQCIRSGKPAPQKPEAKAGEGAKQDVPAVPRPDAAKSKDVPN